jgi:hypothetical protein
MIIPDSEITPLDPRFPIALTGTIPLFGALLAEWEDRVTVIEQAKRAAEQATRREERFVTPAPQPRFVPADTVIDMRVHDGDRFPGEDEARWQAQRDAAADRAEDTDTVIAIIDQADAHERKAAERRTVRRVRRFVVRLVRGT